MKRIYLLFYALIAFNVVIAQTYINGLYYNLNDETMEAEVTVNPYGFYSGDIVIPVHVTYSGKPYLVTGIGEHAFQGCTELSSISLYHITRIGRLAFDRCNNISSISIPNVISIGEKAFHDCSGLTSAEIGSNVEEVGYNAFSGCSSLVYVELYSNHLASKEYSTESNLTCIFGIQAE